MTNLESYTQGYIPKINPKRPAPPEVLWQIIALPVDYVDYQGKNRQGVIEVNQAVAEDVKDFFALALEIGFPIDKVVKSSDPEYGWDDGKLTADNTSSSFNYRLIKDTDRVSWHGLGTALDINTRTNPYIRFVDATEGIDPDGTVHRLNGVKIVEPEGAEYDSNAPGALTTDHPLVMRLKERGWIWGGDWTEDEKGVIDYQHLEKHI